MAKRIRFGGPNLKAPAHTWYETIAADGSLRHVRAEVGHEVDAAEVQHCTATTATGAPVMEPYAERMVRVGFATWVRKESTATE